MKKTKTLLLFLLFVAFVGLTACGMNQKKDTWKKIEESKAITIGYEPDFAPLTSSDGKPKPEGLVVDLAEKIFQPYGVKINWKAIDWSAKEKALKEGEVDLVWGPYVADRTREKDFLFSHTYLTTRPVVLVDKAADIHNIGDMHGLAVGGQKASAEYELFSKHPEVLKNIVKENLMFLYDSPRSALTALKEGKVQAVLLDETYAKTYLEKNHLSKNYSILNTSYPQETYAVAARKKDTALIDKVNGGLHELQSSGEYSKLSEQWIMP